MSDIECPYCGAGKKIKHNDGYDEGEIYQQECSECEKTFAFTTEISISYLAYKADCLNGSPHNYRRTNTYPKWAARERCTTCGDEKPIPLDERKRLFSEDPGGVIIDQDREEFERGCREKGE
jgi:hypothetical protein